MTNIKNVFKYTLPIIPAFLIYFYFAHKLDFIQDDAYITFRYVANFLNGHGLVYNIGERIEGFTNFGWTIYLTMWGALGFDYISIAKYSGLVFGALSLVLTYLISLKVIGSRSYLFALLPVYLVAINMSFAYWAPAGLETAAFTFLTLLSIHLYLKRSWLLIATLALAVWVRPEGALVAIILIIIEALEKKTLPRYTFFSALSAFVVSIPYLVFKISYYGSIFPNPFYAKTGFDFLQIVAGLDYTGLFLLHYGFLGVAFFIAFILYRKLSPDLRAVLIFSTFYMAYVTLIGGDVLKVHRFFLPIFGLSAILMAAVLVDLFENFQAKTRHLLFFLFALILMGLTYKLPEEHVVHYNGNEIAFVDKMSFMANAIKKSDSTDFSVAIGTIGRFGYELLGHRIIDILGLTDSVIARHPQTDIKDIETTWRERKFNVKYILEQAPDYIMFSTGSKPSSPAEKALLLYPSFFNSYNAVPWTRKASPDQLMGVPLVAFKKVRPVNPDLSVRYPIAYVEYLKKALEYLPSRNFDSSLIYIDSSLMVSPKPYNQYVYYEKSFSLSKLGRKAEAIKILDEVVAKDSLFLFANRDAYLYARILGDTAKANTHARWIRKVAPWYWGEIKAIVDNQMASRAQQRNSTR